MTPWCYARCDMSRTPLTPWRNAIIVCGMSTSIEQQATTLSDLVAEEIRARLARQRLSGRELARRLGVSASWVSYRLTGSQPIDLNDLERIAKALGVSVRQLLPSTDTERYPALPKRTMPRVPAPRRPPGRTDSRRPPRQPTPTRPRTLPRPALPVTAR